jgi:hypothetical protein
MTLLACSSWYRATGKAEQLPFLTQLIRLDVSANNLGVAGARALAKHPLNRFRLLDLRGNPLRPAGRTALLAAGWRQEEFED